jgi:phytoene synthase
MTPDEYCQDRAARSGSSFYYSFLFLPKLQRRAIMALYAYCREVDDIVDDCKEDTIAQKKLDWWRSEIEQLYGGTPQHPVTRALASVLETIPIKKEYFHEIITGMEMDLINTQYETFADLYQYCYRVASVVGMMSAEIFGYHNPQTLQYAEELGIALQLTNIIRDIREDADRQRIYIPREDMDNYALTVSDMLASSPQSENAIRALLGMQIDRAQDYYRNAFEHLPDEDRAQQRSGIIMAKIYREILDKIADEPMIVMRERIGLSPLRKLWIAWRTYRKEVKQYGQAVA